MTTDQSIKLLKNSIIQLFSIQNNLDLININVDPMSDLICQLKDDFVQYNSLSQDQIDYIFNI